MGLSPGHLGSSVIVARLGAVVGPSGLAPDHLRIAGAEVDDVSVDVGDSTYAAGARSGPE